MTESVSPSATESWVRSFEEAASRASGRGQLELHLERLLAATGASAAALYIDGEAGAVRDLVVGDGEFPLRAPGEAEPGQRRLALPGGYLLLAGMEDSSDLADKGVATAAATATRAYLLEQRLKRQRFEVNYRGVELEALYDVGLAIASTLNLKELSEEILLRAVSLLDARRGV